MNLKNIPEDRILDFALEAQHRTGLPIHSKLIQHFVLGLESVRVTDEMLEKCLDASLDACITMAHKIYGLNKTWNSYDW